MKKELTLKKINERVDSLEEKIDQILNATKNNYSDSKSKEIETYLLNVETLKSDCTNPDDFLNLVKSKSKEFTDEHKNIYVQLPTIWLHCIGNNEYNFTFEPVYGAIELQPQAISKYKNSLVEGKIRSIPNHAPDFTQFSFNKANKFCKWVDGEQLNWKTMFYIQIMWAYAYQTKNNDKILPNENWKWTQERDCGFNDTGKGIGEFLGIEQLFTSGRNFVSFDNRDELEDLWDLYVSWNYDSDFDADNKFGIWGDYDKKTTSKCAFCSGWLYVFSYAWLNGNYWAVRLCKTILKGC